MNYNRIFFSLKNRCRIKTQFFLSLKMDILKNYNRIFFSFKKQCRIKTQFFLSLKMDILKIYI